MAASKIAEAYVQIVPRIEGMQASLKTQLGDLSKAGKTAGDDAGKGFSGSFGKALFGVGALIATTFSVRAIVDFSKQAVIAAEGVETANARVASIAKSMNLFGGSTDQVTQRLIKYAEANEFALATDAESIKATQAKLLTFKNLAATADEAGGAFDRATVAAIDLAAAGFGEAEGNAVALGKALNDPIKGVASLGRMGVQFTEEQKGMIKSLVETGDVASAQEMILKELESQVGGTAAATANASDQMAIAFGNLQETAGFALLPAFQTVNQALTPLIEYFLPKLEDFLANKIAPFAQNAADAFAGFSTQLTSGGEGINGFFENMLASIGEFFTGDGLKNLITSFTEMRTTLINGFIEVIPAIVGAIAEILPAIITTLAEMIPQLLDSAVDTFTALVDAVIEVTPVIIQALLGMLPTLIQTIVSLLPEILDAGIELFMGLVNALIDVIPMIVKEFAKQAPTIMDAIIKALPLIIDAAFDLFSGLIEGLIEATPEIIDAVVGLIPVIVEHLMDNLPKIIEAGIEIVKGLVSGIVDNAPRLLGEAVGALGNTLINGVEKLLEINSPSKVFERIGEGVGEGMVNGIDRSVGAVATAAAKLAKAAVPNGYEWVMGPNGPYLESKAFTSGKSDKSVSDFGAASASFLLRQQGFDQTEIDNILRESIGGTLNQVNATMNRGVTLINEATNTMTMGNLSDADIAEKIAQGFEVVEKIAAPVEDLQGAVSDLINTIQAGNAGNYLTPFATGGYVTGPTPALIGEAGPEVVTPLKDFERMMGLGNGSGTINYYAAPNQSLDSEQALFQAMRRAKVVANW